MSLLWTWVEELAEPGAIRLTPEEARHVTARRLRVGDALVVFDGRGHRADARLESLGKHASVVIDTVQETAPPDPRFLLASAIPKGDRLSTMLQMLTQLGVAAWQPLVLDDSVVRRLDPRSPRLVRILTESCKVSRRAWRLEIREPCSLDEAIRRRPDEAILYYGDREGEEGGIVDSAGLVLIGPEAGFSEAERRMLSKAGARAISFAPYNLRIETAASAAAVAFRLAGRATSSDHGPE